MAPKSLVGYLGKKDALQGIDICQTANMKPIFVRAKRPNIGNVTTNKKNLVYILQLRT